MALSENENTYLELVQWVRILDVIFIGPVMIYGGLLVRDKRVKMALIFLGLMTVIFNAYNYYLHDKAKRG